MAGRPSTYTDEIGEQICDIIASSNKSLHTISKELGVPYGTIREWIRTVDIFSTNYARAKEDQADFLAEEIIGIADDGTNDVSVNEDGATTNNEVIQRSRLRVDARKWIASKLKPKKYGDRLELDGEIKNDSPISSELAAAIAAKLNLNADIPG